MSIADHKNACKAVPTLSAKASALPNVKASAKPSDDQSIAVAKERFLAFIDRNNILMMAWDFDQTIVSLHTGNQFAARSGKELAMKLDDLASLVSLPFLYTTQWLRKERPWVQMYVLSFSDDRANGVDPQSGMIRFNGKPLIEAVLKRAFHGRVVECIIPWIEAQMPTKLEHGKTQHLVAAMRHYAMTQMSRRLPVDELASHFCLVDDDPANVEMARKLGWNACPVAKRHGFTWDDLATLCTQRTTHPQPHSVPHDMLKEFLSAAKEPDHPKTTL